MMDDDVLATLVIGPVIIFAFCGVIWVTGGSLDSTVVKACKEQGYWQTGQTRIMCGPETNPPKVPEKK